jgi:hypothetical protein
MTIHPVGAKPFHVDGQRKRETGMLRLTILVYKFVNASKKCFVYKSEGKTNGKKSRRYGRQRQMEKLGC